MAQADWNPWRRLLALPNESRTKTLLIAFLVASVCALLVSGATVLLRPIQTANRAAEEQARIGSLVQGIPGMSDLLAQSGGTLSSVVIDLETGRAAQAVTAATLDSALADRANWTALDAGADIAGLGQRPNFGQIFLLRDGEAISLVLLPLTGQGYGGRIEESSWQSSFSGTALRDETGNLRFGVARGEASTPFEVDGITGATRTGRGVADMVRFWLGSDGYGPLIRAIERGEF